MFSVPPFVGVPSLLMFWSAPVPPPPSVELALPEGLPLPDELALSEPEAEPVLPPLELDELEQAVSASAVASKQATDRWDRVNLRTKVLLTGVEGGPKQCLHTT